MCEELKKDPIEADRIFVPNLFGDEEKVYILKPNSTIVIDEIIESKE